MATLFTLNVFLIQHFSSSSHSCKFQNQLLKQTSKLSNNILALKHFFNRDTSAPFKYSNFACQ